MRHSRITAAVIASAVALGALGVAAIAQDAPPVGPASAGPVIGDAEAAAIASNSPTFDETSGERLYMTVCAACHMPDGQGASGAGTYPALAENRRLMAGGYGVYVVMKGMNGMPPLGDMMTDQQVADVVNYVRTHFGNDYADPVGPEDVAALR